MKVGVAVLKLECAKKRYRWQKSHVRACFATYPPGTALAGGRRRYRHRCRRRRAGTAVTAAAPVSVLRACGFGERNRVNGAVVSIWFSVSHCQCVRSAATAAVCPKSPTSYFRVYSATVILAANRNTVVDLDPSPSVYETFKPFFSPPPHPRVTGPKNFKIIRVVRPAIKLSTPIALPLSASTFPFR